MNWFVVVYVYIFLLPPKSGVCLHVYGRGVGGGYVVTGGRTGPTSETGTEFI